ncbi:MAG: hypothetical protein ACOC0F_01345 [archaeon]
MPDDELVVSDTSPLLDPALIDQLYLVREGFSTRTTVSCLESS